MPRITFDKLTKAEQRVVIAKDLLTRLQRKTFTPRTFMYLRVRGAAKNEADARKALREADCRGCQIGGFFLCALDRHNRLKLTELGLMNTSRRGERQAGDGMLRDYLSQWFSIAVLDEVEGFFEGFDRIPAMGQFVELVPEPADRMKMIAQNIVEGNGRFSARRLMKTARSLRESSSSRRRAAA